ncbi:MAG TPA: peptidoglycan -binding protein [Stellaceae bacterium]|jgi:chemotaxis protein MotB|nr:peptidoglycan -binding protein [Stellaceae bacterium]
MSLYSRRQRRSTINIWPGFVDALTQLVMVIIFVLLVFTAGQFYLTGALSNRDAALAQLTRQVNELTDMLSLQKSDNATLQLNLSKLSGELQSTTTAKNAAEAKIGELGTQLSGTQQQLAQKTQDLGKAQTTVDQLNQQLLALRQQLAQIAAALDVSETKNKQQQAQITDLGNRLNQALATKVAELAKYRSEFFGRLRAILANRQDIRIVGDRFVFQSDVLFDTGSADLTPAAQTQLASVAQALKQLSSEIPNTIDWVLEVDGHTDARPIHTAEFPSNWELSSARAQSVVRFLISQGIPPNRLVAAGFGQYTPIAAGNTDADYAQNRRIELKLTER